MNNNNRTFFAQKLVLVIKYTLQIYTEIDISKIPSPPNYAF